MKEVRVINKPNLNITEMFPSIQGEGRWIGVPAFFIRLSGCNLRCSFCDTAYSWEKGKEYTQEEITKQINQSKLGVVVWTGGEPLLQPSLLPIVSRLQNILPNISHHLETNGSINFGKDEIPFDYITISPKFDFLNLELKVTPSPSSTDKYFDNIPMLYDRITEEDKEYDFKFVIQDESDINKIIDFQKQLSLPSSHIIIMPETITSFGHKLLRDVMVKACMDFGWRYSPRLQVILWENQKGK